MELTHFNKDGLARMVDISDKKVTDRIAKAKIEIHMAKETLERIKLGDIKKGNVLAVAQVAGILAAKKTYEIIPMCHNIPLSSADISFNYLDDGIEIISEIKASYGTGAEMEALTACNVAALTIYDMVKAIDKKMYFTNGKLIYKNGGKSGEFINE